MIYIYYLIVIGVIYLIFQTWVNYRIDKIEKEISAEILFSVFKNKK
jgi:hypothetical protein